MYNIKKSRRCDMITDTKNLISITEANQNFSKVVKSIEQNGDVIILKNNKPQYIVSKFDNKENTVDEDAMTMVVANMILTEHSKAFEELGK